MLLDGESPEELTSREREVLALVNQGLTNREIARQLQIKENAVRFHLKHLHAKLSTDSDRAALATRSVRGWHAFTGLLFGRLGMVASVGAFGVAMGATAFGAYIAYPGDSSANGTPPPLVDGLYPNGCPAEFNAGTMTLADFARGFHTSIDVLRALNPGLGDGPLAPETLVRVPYDPDGTCGKAEPTMPGANQAPVDAGASASPSPIATPPGRIAEVVATPGMTR